MLSASIFARQTARTVFRTGAVRFNSSAASSSSKPAVTESEVSPHSPGHHLTTAAPKEEIIEADVLSDAPHALHYRSVRIFSPTKSTMQSGAAKYDEWRIDWDILPGSDRWENKLMGWGSSADYMQGTTMRFRTKEEAIHFAEKQGWDYQVVKQHQARIPPKVYADNYVHVPGKLRIHHTK